MLGIVAVLLALPAALDIPELVPFFGGWVVVWGFHELRVAHRLRRYETRHGLRLLFEIRTPLRPFRSSQLYQATR